MSRKEKRAEGGEAPLTPRDGNNSLLFIAACVKKIVELGRLFPQPRPERDAPGVGASGFGGTASVPAYFDEAPTASWLRRFRCPDCWAM
ncbi:hypothetical protein DFAR_2300014 [Desulfarculales bacterium]